MILLLVLIDMDRLPDEVKNIIKKYIQYKCVDCNQVVSHYNLRRCINTHCHTFSSGTSNYGYLCDKCF